MKKPPRKSKVDLIRPIAEPEKLDHVSGGNGGGSGGTPPVPHPNV
jgi:hypothetical protein